MNITAENKKIIIDEIAYVIKSMRASQSNSIKLFFLSAIPGVIQRIVNIEYDATLSYTGFIIQIVYERINSIVARVATGQERVIQLPDELFALLENLLENLSEEIENDGEIQPIMENLAELAVITTGNGYYLYKKGIIQIT